MRIRIQLNNPRSPMPSDRRRLLCLLREFESQGLDVALYRAPESFDVLILADKRYGMWLPLVREARRHRRIVIHDVVDDVFSFWRSHLVLNVGSISAHMVIARRGLRRALQRFLHVGTWGKASAFWKHCSAIVTGSSVQAGRYEPYNRYVYHLVDPVDPLEFQGRADHRARKPVTAVWEGTCNNPAFFDDYLDAFRDLSDRGIARFRIITDRRRTLAHRGYWENDSLFRSWKLAGEFVEWNLSQFSRDLCSGDIGIAPMPAGDPFAAAKPANKILGYAFLGLPVVASPIASYIDAIGAGKFGFVARSADDWLRYVTELAEDPVLRKHLGEMGRSYVLSEATPALFAKRYFNLITGLLDEGFTR